MDFLFSALSAYCMVVEEPDHLLAIYGHRDSFKLKKIPLSLKDPNLSNFPPFISTFTGIDVVNDTKTMVVPFLETAILYEGYLLYSVYGIGNGAPSERFRFQTSFDRKCFCL